MSSRPLIIGAIAIGIAISYVGGMYQELSPIPCVPCSQLDDLFVCCH
jgi:hypothetical protein